MPIRRVSSGYVVVHGEPPATITLADLTMKEAVFAARALTDEGKQPRIVDSFGRTVALEHLEPLLQGRPYR